MRKKLQDVFEEKVWRASASGMRSGPGSTLEATARVRDAFPEILKRYNVKTLLDAPCGDFHWMKEIELGDVTYIGGDISAQIIDDIKGKYTSDKVSFQHLDITSDPLPDADLMLCRECLFHLKHRFKWAFFRNFAASNIEYLMMTMHHFPENPHLSATGNFQPFSPKAPPFNFPEPLEMLHETVDELPTDLSEVEEPLFIKSLGIWRRDDVIKVLEGIE